ncbi:hypothetical protein KEM54_002744 [Ascosphaera aggregata]|nr:hypothetical protein KEM54_002744 [Ascosphaera aggregata]
MATISVASATERIQQYIRESHLYEKQRNKRTTLITAEEYETRIDATLRALQEQSERQEKELEELRRTRTLHLPKPTSTPAERLAQTRRATAAYRALYEEKPFLPEVGSVAPDLLALRETAESVNGLKRAIALTADDLVNARERLRREEADLQDAKAINRGLHDRLAALRRNDGNDDTGEAASDPTRRLKQFKAQYRQQKLELDEKTKKLHESLDEFIDQTLAAMLAAEELGGPPVGDQLSISDETLDIGYTSRGKERRNKMSAGDVRQKKIDAMVNGDDGHPNARVVAGDEFRDLLRRLIEALPTSSYITLDRDCVASRFLVKAKIAQYHPRDSRRLRLIDVTRKFD